MRSSELREIEKARAAERPARPRRIAHRDTKPANVIKPRNLRAEVEQAFRDVGAKIFREDRQS